MQLTSVEFEEPSKAKQLDYIIRIGRVEQNFAPFFFHFFLTKTSETKLNELNVAKASVAKSHFKPVTRVALSVELVCVINFIKI